MKESKFQFLNPTLESLVYKINKDFDSEKFEGIQMKSETTIKKAINESDRSAIVELKVEVGSQDSVSPFFASIVMGSEFHWDDGLSEDRVDNFLKCNAPALLLSYIRPHIANLTNSSNYNSYNLPFMDFTDSESSGCDEKNNTPKED